MERRFEWNSAKAEANEQKHGVRFVEAATVFGDPLSATMPDPIHSEREDRFLLFGRSSGGRTLVVVAVEYGSRIRLISAREMTPKEQRNYEEGTYGAA